MLVIIMGDIAFVLLALAFFILTAGESPRIY